LAHELRSYCGNRDLHDEHSWELIYCVFGAICGQGTT
jgi:hypothetical protein